MLVFFDYLCFWIYKAYKRGGDSSPEFLGSSVVSFLQTLNICSGITLVDVLKKVQEPSLSKLTAVILFTSLVVLNYIRYIWIAKFSIDAISNRWNLESEKYRTNSRYLQISYVILSTVVFFGMVLHFAVKKM